MGPRGPCDWVATLIKSKDHENHFVEPRRLEIIQPETVSVGGSICGCQCSCDQGQNVDQGLITTILVGKDPKVRRAAGVENETATCPSPDIPLTLFQ